MFGCNSFSLIFSLHSSTDISANIFLKSFTSWPFKNKQNKWQSEKIHLIITDIQVNKQDKTKILCRIMFDFIANYSCPEDDFAIKSKFSLHNILVLSCLFIWISAIIRWIFSDYHLFCLTFFYTYNFYNLDILQRHTICHIHIHNC